MDSQEVHLFSRVHLKECMHLIKMLNAVTCRLNMRKSVMIKYIMRFWCDAGGMNGDMNGVNPMHAMNGNGGMHSSSNRDLRSSSSNGGMSGRHSANKQQYGAPQESDLLPQPGTATHVERREDERGDENAEY